MNCNEFELYAAQHAECVPPAGSPAAAHLRDCPRCAARMADFDRIVAAAASLPAFDPPERIWIALRANLEHEGMFHRRPGLLERLGMPAAPGTALATAALCALAAFMLAVPSRVAGPERAAGIAPSMWSFPQINQQLATAEAEENRDLQLRDPQVVASYQQNLALVDNLIGVCQKSVDENPDDEMARDYLLTAYQQKADLLSALSERGALGD